MRFRSRFLINAIAMAACVATVAEAKDPRSLAQRLDGFPLAEMRAGSVPVRDAIDIDRQLRGFVYYALPPAALQGAFKDFLKTVEAARVDQQLGVNPSA